MNAPKGFTQITPQKIALVAPQDDRIIAIARALLFLGSILTLGFIAFDIYSKRPQASISQVEADSKHPNLPILATKESRSPNPLLLFAGFSCLVLGGLLFAAQTSSWILDAGQRKIVVKEYNSFNTLERRFKFTDIECVVLEKKSGHPGNRFSLELKPKHGQTPCQIDCRKALDHHGAYEQAAFIARLLGAPLNDNLEKFGAHRDSDAQNNNAMPNE